MSQLYPPYIEGTLPAFHGDTIKVPFEMNPAVSWSEVAGFVLKVKNIYTNEEIGILDISLDDTNKRDIQQNKVLSFKGFISSVEFDKLVNKYNLYLSTEKEYEEAKQELESKKNTMSDEEYKKQLDELEKHYKEILSDHTLTEEQKEQLKNTPLIIGLSYKFQLAYKGTDEIIGYYSTVGVAKYTNKPTIIIDSLSEEQNNTQVVINLNKQIFVGKYTNEDVTEKVYSYRFDIYDQKNQLILSSGQILHNNEYGTQLINANGNKIQCTDQFLLQKELDYYASYKIQYSVKTINGLEISSPKYTIVAAPTVEPDINATPQAALNAENGYIEITFNQYMQPTLTGKFLLVRASDKDNYKEWNTMANYIFNVQITKDWSYKDFTVEHGVSYKYAFCQYNVKKEDESIVNIVSNRRESNEIKVEFDSMFLYDGERQLKINYNPKVSSFKINTLESKTDTIGGQFPYFFRNGNVKYREFPISGLISYWSDNEELFLKKEDMLLDKTVQSRIQNDSELVAAFQKLKPQTTNLEAYNFDAEREFKIQVLDFLTNGKPKLFRSAPEGSYLVRLMNTSLSPNDTLGRMLHTFSSTAYEIADLNYDNLLEYKMIDITPYQNQELFGWHTIDLSTISLGTNLLKRTAYSINIEDVPQGAKIIIGDQEIVIGQTWQYKPDGMLEPFNILIVDWSGVDQNKYPKSHGLITYSYKINGKSEFDRYEKIENSDIIIEFSKENNNQPNETNGWNIIKQLIEDDNILNGFNFIKFEKQEFDNDDNIHLDDNKEPLLNDYEIGFSYSNIHTFDEKISIEQSGQLFVEDLDKMTYLELGRGVKAIISARRTKIYYYKEEK